MKFNTKYLFIALALSLSYFITSFMNDTVFVAGMPRLRQNIGNNIIVRLNKDLFHDNFIAKSIQKFTDKQNEKTGNEILNAMNQKLNSIPFSKIAPGVYAKTDDKTIITEYKSDEVIWVQYTYHVDGREVKINVPQGQTPPSQQEVEILNQ